METIFLWFIACLDGSACLDSQVYTVDQFHGVAAVSDCEARRLAWVAQLDMAGLPGQRLVCKTYNQFQNEGASHAG